MKEDFLHYAWKFQKFPPHRLQTQCGEALEVLNVGQHNQHDGPDFLLAEIKWKQLRWSGSVELHLKSSDWYRHLHHKDPAYDNVILHVVWEDDLDVCRSDGSPLPTLVVAPIVSKELIHSYKEFFKPKNSFIPCEGSIKEFPPLHWIHWKERMYIERLTLKSARIEGVLKSCNGDWEAALFLTLARNFGLNVNGESFYEIARSIPFSVVRKVRQDAENLEALFLGQAGLISSNTEEPYAKLLWKKFSYLKHKFGLPQSPQVPLFFSRLRPPNFPTIRWVQLAQLYARTSHLFSSIFSECSLKTEWMEEINVSEFWLTHYTFDKASRKRSKPLSKSFVELLTINTFLPFYFCHQKALGNDPSSQLFQWISAISAEKNSLTDQFKSLGVPVKDALDSQALIQLKHSYCEPKKCLLCAIGIHLLKHPK